MLLHASSPNWLDAGERVGMNRWKLYFHVTLNFISPQSIDEQSKSIVLVHHPFATERNSRYIWHMFKWFAYTKYPCCVWLFLFFFLWQIWGGFVFHLWYGHPSILNEEWFSLNCVLHHISTFHLSNKINHQIDEILLLVCLSSQLTHAQYQNNLIDINQPDINWN